MFLLKKKTYISINDITNGHKRTRKRAAVSAQQKTQTIFDKIKNEIL